MAVWFIAQFDNFKNYFEIDSNFISRSFCFLCFNTQPINHYELKRQSTICQNFPFVLHNDPISFHIRPVYFYLETIKPIACNFQPRLLPANSISAIQFAVSPRAASLAIYSDIIETFASNIFDGVIFSRRRY